MNDVVQRVAVAKDLLAEMRAGGEEDMADVQRAASAAQDVRVKHRDDDVTVDLGVGGEWYTKLDGRT